MSGPGDSMIGDTIPDGNPSEREAVRIRLLAADQSFDAGPTGRRDALATYAELADSIEPDTAEGAARVSRILTDPRPPDRRMVRLFGRASVLVADVELRERCHFAAARFALADWQFQRAEAVLDQAIAESRRRGQPRPPQLLGLRVVLRISQGREHEALEEAARFERTVLEISDAIGLAFAARHSAVTYLIAGGASQALDAFALCETRSGALSEIAAAALRARAGIDRSRALRAVGDLDGASASVDLAEAAAGNDSEEIVLRALVARERAEIRLLRGDPDGAVACLRTISVRDLANPLVRVSCWLVAAEAAALSGNDRAANAAALRVIEQTESDQQRTTAALSLERVARLARVLDGGRADESVSRGLDRILVGSTGERCAEIVSYSRTAEPLPPVAVVLLREFRTRFLRDNPAVSARLDRNADATFATRAFGAAGAPGDFCCPCCLMLWDGASTHVPAGHLLPPRVRDSFESAVCPACV